MEFSVEVHFAQHEKWAILSVYGDWLSVEQRDEIRAFEGERFVIVRINRTTTVKLIGEQSADLG